MKFSAVAAAALLGLVSSVSSFTSPSGKLLRHPQCLPSCLIVAVERNSGKNSFSSSISKSRTAFCGASAPLARFRVLSLVRAFMEIQIGLQESR
jgi:hypothetical protein